LRRFFDVRGFLPSVVPAAVWALLFVGARASAQQNDVWTLTAGDFSTRRVAILALSDREIRVRDVVSGEQSTLSWDRLLDLTRDAAVNRAAAAQQGGAMVLLLANGDRIAGEPASQSGESLSWASPVGLFEVPLTQARAIARDPTAADGGSPPIEDDVILANGDRVGGIVGAISRETVQITPTGGGGATELPWDSILAVRFAGTTTDPATFAGVPERAFRVTLQGDTRLSVPSLTLNGEQLLLATGEGAARPVPIRQVLAIEHQNGPVVWLTSLPPSERIHQPYFAGIDLPARVGRAVDGGEIRAPTSIAAPSTMPSTVIGAADRPARAGIGVASYSRLSWSVPPGFSRFRTQVGVAGNLPYANVTVRVLLDGDRVAFEQADLTAAHAPVFIDVPLGEARTITLEVDYGKSLDVQDRVNWIEPALVKSP
jgi:hypothetical protein